MKPVIVLDTNIFVAALLGPTGASRRVLRGCLNKRYQPLMGMALLTEYEDVSGRQELFIRCSLTAHEREKFLDALLSVCRWTRIYYSWRPNLRDEGDNHLIELAVAGNADYLVTKNLRDLRSGELRFPALRCVLPETLLQEEPDDGHSDNSTP
jgi:putative PIN family toxin of toxin-antitoxin system